MTMLAAVRPDLIRERVAQALRAAAAVTGDGRYRVALGIATGARGGRPAHDDGESLRCMTSALALGRASNPTHAAWLALREAGAEEPDTAAVKRLTRKYRHQHKESCRA